MSFVERKIEIAIQLAQLSGGNQPNTFAETGADTVTIKDLRTSIRIQNAGSISGYEAQITVWGLAPELINQLSTLGMKIQQFPSNWITATAGDAVGGMSTVFSGNIWQADADYNSLPDVPFHFQCKAGVAAQTILFPASSYTGATDVATILSNIAQGAGWGFENHGVNAQLSYPYLSGSAVDQVRQVAEAVRINADLIPGTLRQNQKQLILRIYPRYSSVPTPGIPLLAPPPEGQMIGYPSYTPSGIIVRSIFDPRIIRGGEIKVQSEIFTTQILKIKNNPTSVWTVERVDLALDAKIPRSGQWSTTAYAYTNIVGQPPPLPPRR